MKLICYLSNGYPSIKESVDMAAHYVEAGCDIIEVDLPARDPYLEGELIASRMSGALRACNDYDRFMEAAVAIKANHPDVAVLLLVYEETIREIGPARFIDFCLKNDMRDLIVVGHDPESLKEHMIARGLRVSCYVRFNLPEEEVAAALRSNGFVYMQAKPISCAVDPAYPTLKDCIAQLRKRGIDRNIYCGVGVYTPEDVAMVRESGGDGVFVGSAILKTTNDLPRMREVIRRFKDATA
jgi:tryptophan synthase alpha chain